ncbi:HAD-IIB family hydrolase, partial [Streptococcus pyogenes]
GDVLQLSDDLLKDVRLVRWHENSSDVIKNGISKASGLAHVLEKLNLKPENLLVFGDAPNDMELFDYAGLSVAMGVSDPELQKKADF